MCSIKVDGFGPSKVLYLFSPGEESSYAAIVIIDNTALGPAMGGVRVSRAVTLDDVARLARTMTFKNSLAGLPHGGGKAGIIADPGDPAKESYFRAFARAIRGLTEYIPGPDMGSDEIAMAWVYDEIGRATGLPEEIGGIPLDKLGATGFGLSECAEVACPYAGVTLSGARVAIQGFGSVGRAAARFLSEKGAVIVAVSDTSGGIYEPDGLDVGELVATKKTYKSVIKHKTGKVLPGDALFLLDCDILIPAAGPDVIHQDNIGKIRAGMILQGANIPMTCEAEEIAHERGILAVPDFIANAGGVIAAASEYARRTEKEAFEAISAKIKRNTEKVLEKSKKEGMLPRDAAIGLAGQRIQKAMGYRRNF